jgi:feruloyl-CoA synthase
VDNAQLHRESPPASNPLAERLPSPAVDCRILRDGSFLLRSRLPLIKPRASVIAMLEEAAQRHPDRAFLRAKTSAHEWAELTFGDAERCSRSMAQWLFDQGLRPRDTVAVLCGAGIDHALFALGAMRIHVGVAALNPIYLRASDSRRLGHCLAIVRPSLLLVDDEPAARAALNALGLNIPLLSIRTAQSRGQAPFDEALQTIPKQDIATLERSIPPDCAARIVFTSGSTGLPKAVPQTHRMLTASMAQTESMGLFDFSSEHPRLLDGLPWHHIFGGNHNFNAALRTAGTITLDDGRPTPELFGRTLENLKSVRPSYIATVPLTLTLLCDALETDAELRNLLLPDLEYLLFGGAGLQSSVVSRLHNVTRSAVGRPLPVLATYGATEMQLVGAVHWVTTRTDLLGVPVPGTEIKLTPVGNKLEIRVRGPSVMPRSGYLDNPDATEKVFDEDGFYRTGDTAVLAEPDRPEAGLIFDGRLAEEFKLASGTWVSAGTVRENVLTACSPLLLEAVVCGLNQDELGLLAWLNFNAADATGESVREALRQRIQLHNARWKGSSMRIGRMLLATRPLATADGEITDKGSVNISKVWQSRGDDIEKMFASVPGEDVMIFAPGE